MSRFLLQFLAVFLGVLFALMANSAIEAVALRQALGSISWPNWGMGGTPMSERRAVDARRLARIASGECPPGYGRGVIEAHRDGRTERESICVAPLE